MVVPTAQPQAPEQRPPVPGMVLWLRKLWLSMSRPLIAVVLAMFVGGIVIMFTSNGSLLDRFSAALTAYQYLFIGSFGSLFNFSYTLTIVAPLILAGLSVAIAFRAGLFNIGAEGQLAVGAMTAGIIGLKLGAWPGWALIPLMLLSSMFAGAVWGGIVGALKAWRGAHEVVTTIMLNWIAFYVTDYLIDGPFKAPFQANQTETLPAQATLPKVSLFYNNTLGTFLPKIAQPEGYLVDVGVFFALLALVIYWFLMARTTFGYEVRVIGQNQKAARYAGISVKRNIFMVMAIAGAFSGLAGAIGLMGQFPYQLIGTTFSLDPTGFDAIGVALLGRTSAIGVFISALLFGGLRQGSSLMQLKANVPGDLVFIVQALVLFSIAAEFLPAARRAISGRLAASRKPAIVPAIAGLTVEDLPANGAGSASTVHPVSQEVLTELGGESSPGEDGQQETGGQESDKSLSEEG